MESNSQRPPETAKPIDHRLDVACDPPAAAADPDDASDLDNVDQSCPDEAAWDVFIPDDDERDPLPERGDFWGSVEPGAGSMEYY